MGKCEAALSSKPEAIVAGAVRADSGEPLAYANIFFADGFEGTMADTEGRFFIKVTKFGERTLLASYIARETQSKTITIEDGDSLYVEFILAERPIKMKKIVSRASSYTIADRDGVTLTSLDVVRTPGAAADVFRALQMFPGTVQMEEGAGLFVRGGDVSETLTFLDLATVAHPYRYSSPTGGFFGMFDPFLLDGIYFSTGGFSAKYGNALSGIVELESKGLPRARSISTTASLAALSVMGVVPLGRAWGIRFAGNFSHTDLLFRVNGGKEDFDKVPRSADGSLSFIGKLGAAGSVKLFAFTTEDDIGVRVESPAYDGLYQGNGKTRLGNLSFSQLLGEKLLIKGSLSRTSYEQVSALGVLDVDTDDLIQKVRLDASLRLRENVKLNFGTEAERRSTDVRGKAPDDENNFAPNADFITFSTRYRAVRFGDYLEFETSPTGRLLVNAGVRLDHESNTGEWIVDPRASAALQLTPNGSLKVSWGVYHQFPEPYYYDPLSGNPDLGPMNSIHFIVGYDYEKEPFRARVEGYYKRYRELLLEDDLLNLTNDGYGYARGIDLFLKGNLGFMEGRVAYSYLRARRKEHEKKSLVPADFDITHTLNLVLTIPLPHNFELGMARRLATGKPYTPAPGEFNSLRLPRYDKLDLSLSKIHSFFPGNLTVFFVAIANVMNRENIQDYLYSPDYSERKKLRSFFDRSIYFGVSTTVQ